MSFNVESKIKTFGGSLLKLSHKSKAVNSKMDVNVFLPPSYDPNGKKTPVLIYLSGLTCTPANVTEKGGWFQHAANYGFALVFPDTSPREVDAAYASEDCYYVGTGAGFYVNATEKGWSDNFQMYSYIDKELPQLLSEEFPALDFEENISITGHSMGGFGAILHFLTNKTQKYKSCSAFSPASNIYENMWTEAAFSKYLGEDRSNWEKYDLAKIIKEYPNKIDDKILIHVGLADNFYQILQCDNLVQASELSATLKGKLDLQKVEGYDHSYFFISTFVPEHARHHAKSLGLLV